jgi:hypothetical protein
MGNLIPKRIIYMYPYLTRDERVKSMKTEGRFFPSYVMNKTLQNYCDWLCQCSDGGPQRGD